MCKWWEKKGIRRLTSARVPMESMNMSIELMAKS